MALVSTALTVAIALVGVATPASASAGSVELIASSLSRTPSGTLSYDVTASASGFRGTNTACMSSNNGTACSLHIEAQYEDTTTGRLSSAYNLGSTSPITHQFIGTGAFKKVVAIRAIVHGYNYDIVGDWNVISDPYPGPSVALFDATLIRTSAGTLSYDVTTSAEGYRQPGRACANVDYGFACTLRVEAQYDDGTTGTLAFRSLATAGDPVAHQFTGTVKSKRIIALRVVVDGYISDIIGGWSEAGDSYPSAAALLSISSIERTASSSLSFDITATAAGYRAPGRACANADSGFGCSLKLEAEYADGTIGTIGSVSIRDMVQDPVGHVFTGTITTTRQLVAVRVLIDGHVNDVVEPWLEVSEVVLDGHDLVWAEDALVGAYGAGSAYTACVNAFARGTHQAGSSLTDQQIACLGATQAGQTFREFIRSYLKTITSSQVTALLAGAGIDTRPNADPNLDWGKSLPAGCSWADFMTISCPDGLHRPASAPAQQDPTWGNNRATNSATARVTNGIPEDDPIPDQNTPIGQPLPSRIAMDVVLQEQCQENAVRWGEQAGIEPDDCDSLPIFGTGNNSPEASQHDLDAIIGNPEWMRLHYFAPSEKLAEGKPRASSWPNCTGTASMQCDEFPYYSTDEGWPDGIPDVKQIPQSDNASQAGKLTSFYHGCARFAGTQVHTEQRAFLVVPIPALPTWMYCP